MVVAAVEDPAPVGFDGAMSGNVEEIVLGNVEERAPVGNVEEPAPIGVEDVAPLGR